MVGGIHHAVVQGHEQRGWLEHGTRLQQVAHGMVVNLSVFSVETFLHVHDGLDVAGRHIHHDGYTHVGVDFLQLLDERTLGKILHAHVDGGHDVGSVDRRGIGDVEELVAHLAAVHDTVGSAQDGVVAQLQSEAGGILGAEHGSDGTSGKRTVGTGAGIIFLPVETALVGRHAEHRQTLHLGKGVVVDAAAVYCPVAALLASPLYQIALEFLSALLREYLVQTLADGILLHIPQRVVLGGRQCLEVHKHLELRQRTRHQLTGAAQDVASVRLHGHGIFLLSLGNLHPVVVLGSHDVECLAHDGSRYQSHDDGDGAVAGHYFLMFKLAHSSGTLMM